MNKISKRAIASDAWSDWVFVPEGKTERRKLVVQFISAWKLAYRWQSFGAALDNMKFFTRPEESQESPKEAIKTCKNFSGTSRKYEHTSNRNKDTWAIMA